MYFKFLREKSIFTQSKNFFNGSPLTLQSLLVGEIQKAVECAESVLMFDPNHSAMLRNKIYYQTLEKADVSWFESRPEARKYLDRDQAEKKLLQFIDVEFAYYNNKIEGKNLTEENEVEQEEVVPSFLFTLIYPNLVS